MKTIPKSPPPITLNLSEEGKLVARDIFGRQIPIRMSESLRKRLTKNGDASEHISGKKTGTVMPDGTIYAGISPDTGEAFYAAAHDSPKPLRWQAAIEYARKSNEHGNNDWRVPSAGELNALFNNRTVIGGFDLSGSYPAGWYWSSSEGLIYNARTQRFSDGFQYSHLKYAGLSVRCVR